MGKFDRNSGGSSESSRFSSRSSGGPKRSFGGSSSRRGDSEGGRDRFQRNDDSSRFNRRSGGDFEKRMHRVTCDKCSKSCEVPFRPTEGKPVYCSDCFRKEDGGGSSRSSSSGSMSSEQFNKLNSKLDKILAILEGEVTEEEEEIDE